MKLIQGDCLKEMDTIEDKSIDLILCDLPYGTTACKWDSVIPFVPLWEQYRRIVKPSSATVFTASQPFTSLLVSSNIKNFKHSWVWNKRFAANFTLAKYQPLKIHEDVCVFSYSTANYFPQKAIREVPIKLGKNVSRVRGVTTVNFEAKKEFSGKTYSDKNPESILLFNTRAEGQKKIHPTQKPVALMEYVIKTYSNEGDLVLDNCMGSGTTGVACQN